MSKLIAPWKSLSYKAQDVAGITLNSEISCSARAIQWLTALHLKAGLEALSAS